MEKQSTLTLVTLPQESLHALKSAVAGRFHWRIMTGGKDDHPRFVIEKEVRYDLVRGMPMVALYQIIGGFQKSKSGETTLHYVVSGQAWVPFFSAAPLIGVMLVITLSLGSSVFSPPVGVNCIGVLLVGVLLVTTVGYGWYAYRSYQGHLRELHRFMEEFAQRIQSR